MPFIGLKDGRRVIPEQVDDGEDVWCTHCRERMRPRGPMVDGRARHFFHIGNNGKAGGDCDGRGVGESETHRKYKSFVVSRLKQLYPEFIDSCRPEQQLPVDGEFPSGKEARQADVLMDLGEPTKMFGRGLIVEVQYRNLGKDIEGTTRDYLSAGFSVLWVDEDDFESDRCLLTKKKIRRNVIPVWPNAVPQPDVWGEELSGFDRETSRTLLSEIRAHHVLEFVSIDSSFQSPVKVPATLPREFIDGMAQDLWHQQEWDSLFSPPEDYTDIWCYSKVPATLPPEWHREKAREFWHQVDWKDRFWYEEPEFGEKQFGKTTNLPINKWLLEEGEDGYYRNILRAHHKFGENGVRETQGEPIQRPSILNTGRGRSIVRAMYPPGASVNIEKIKRECMGPGDGVEEILDDLIDVGVVESVKGKYRLSPDYVDSHRG